MEGQVQDMNHGIHTSSFLLLTCHCDETASCGPPPAISLVNQGGGVDKLISNYNIILTLLRRCDLGPTNL